MRLPCHALPPSDKTETGKSDELRVGERKGEGEDLRSSRGVFRHPRRQHITGANGDRLPRPLALVDLY